MKAPAFQFYAADYLADENVQMLTLQEEGAYIRLLAYCWREGSIPADRKKLSRLCKDAPEHLFDFVQDLFEQNPGDVTRFVHKRLGLERKKQEEFRLKKAKAGKESGKSRRNKELSNEHVLNTCSSDVRTEDEQKRTLHLLSSSSSSSSSSKTPISPIGDVSADAIEERTRQPTQEKPKKRRKREMPTGPLADEFETEFWPLVWLKDDKLDASHAYVAKREKYPKERILAGLRKQMPELVAKVARGFHLLPTTWLNRESFLNEGVNKNVQPSLMFVPLAPARSLDQEFPR